MLSDACKKRDEFIKNLEWHDILETCYHPGYAHRTLVSTGRNRRLTVTLAMALFDPAGEARRAAWGVSIVPTTRSSQEAAIDIAVGEGHATIAFYVVDARQRDAPEAVDDVQLQGFARS